METTYAVADATPEAEIPRLIGQIDDALESLHADIASLEKRLEGGGVLSEERSERSGPAELKAEETTPMGRRLSTILEGVLGRRRYIQTLIERLEI